MLSKMLYLILFLLIIFSSHYIYAEESMLPKQSIKNEQRYHPIVKNISKKYNMDSDLIKAVIMVESEFNPTATSNKGAIGLMQILPSTAKIYGVHNLFDPVKNIETGTRHLKSLLKRFKGNISYALAAYNSGSKWVYYYNGVPPFTQKYIKKVYKYYTFFKERRKAYVDNFLGHA